MENNELQKLESFVVPLDRVGSFELRPFTGASMAMLQIIKSPLLSNFNETHDQIFHVGAFIYLHAADLSEVRRAVISPESDFKIKVLEFIEQLELRDVLIEAPKVVKKAMESAAAALEFKVEGEQSDPN